MAHKPDDKDEKSENDSLVSSSVITPSDEFSSWSLESLRPSPDMTAHMLRLAAPTILANFMFFFTTFVTQTFVGRRLGKEALAQFSVGLSVFNIAGLSVGIGFASALDTLASQAYGRSKTSPEIGQLLQRCLVIDLVLCFPLLLGFYLVEGPLVYVYGEELGRGAAVFLKSSWLFLPLDIFNVSLVKALQAQNLPEGQLVSAVVGALTCFVANHYLVADSLAQSIAALTITHAAILLALILFMLLHPRCVMWHARWPDIKAITDLNELYNFFRVGVPSLVSLCTEWWAFEVLIALAAQISDAEVAMLSVCLSITSICFSVALGVSVAGTVCVGNSLGSNNPLEARKYAALTMFLTGCFGLLNATIVITNATNIGALFTSDSFISEELRKIAWLVALFHIGDATQFAFQGIFRGTGKQAQAAPAVVCSLWFVGLPLSALLAKGLKLGTEGILIGLFGGFCVEVPVMIRYVRQWNWVEIAEEAAKSKAMEEEQEEEEPAEGMADNQELVEISHA